MTRSAPPQPDYVAPADMLPASATGSGVMTSDGDGLEVIPAQTPLRWVNYSDGLKLSASVLTADQQAHIDHVRQLARCGNWGVDWGLDVVRTDDDSERLRVSAGLAHDPLGRALVLTGSVEFAVSSLFQGTGSAVIGTGPADFAPCEIDAGEAVRPDPIGTTPWLLTLGWVQGRCGHTETYGGPCGGCAPEPDRPWRIDGVVLRLRPLTLRTPWDTTDPYREIHLRSRLAAAYFADEQARYRWPMSAALLAGPTWTSGAVVPAGPVGNEVPLALLARTDGVTQVMDVWTARRERVSTPAAGQFAGRIGARPEPVFQAQLNQFQAQFADDAGRLPKAAANKLFRIGLGELPPCGYLPVDPSVTIPQWFDSLFGAVADLRYVPMPADAVVHGLLAAQHRDRIPLALPAGADPVPIDILIPDGIASGGTERAVLYRVSLHVDATGKGGQDLDYAGTGRRQDLADGTVRVHQAGVGGVSDAEQGRAFINDLAQGRAFRIPNGAADLDPDLVEMIATQSATRTQRDGGSAVSSDLFARVIPKAAAQPIAAWTELVLTPAPWRVAAGGSAQVGLIVELAGPGTLGTGVGAARIELTATLTDLQTGTGDARNWRLTGSITISQPGRPDRSTALARDVTQVSAGGQERFEIGGLLPVQLPRDPASGPITITAAGVAAAAQPDASVSDPSDADRRRAESALAVLQLARPQDDGALRQRQDDLFGATVAGAPVITGPHDWAGFRRRIADVSAVPVPPPPPTLVDTVQVRLLSAPSVDTAEASWKRLQKDTVATQALLAVQFQRGTDVLVDGEAAKLAAACAAAIPDTAQIRHVGAAPKASPAIGARAAAIAAGCGIGLADGWGPDLIADAVHDQNSGAVGTVVLLTAPTPVESVELLVVLAKVSDVDPGEWTTIADSIAHDDAGPLVAAKGEAFLTEIGRLPITQDKPGQAALLALAKQITAQKVGDVVVPDDYPVLLLDPKLPGEQMEIAVKLGETLCQRSKVGGQSLELKRKAQTDLSSWAPALLLIVVDVPH